MNENIYVAWQGVGLRMARLPKVHFRLLLGGVAMVPVLLILCAVHVVLSGLQQKQQEMIFSQREALEQVVADNRRLKAERDKLRQDTPAPQYTARKCQILPTQLSSGQIKSWHQENRHPEQWSVSLSLPYLELVTWLEQIAACSLLIQSLNITRSEQDVEVEVHINEVVL